MKYEKEEIFNALRMVKEECESNEDCSNCCMKYYDNDGEDFCIFKYLSTPCAWDMFDDGDNE